MNELSRGERDPAASSVRHENHVSPEQVREQLDRLLANPLFGNNRRCKLFLEHAVIEALAGHADNLKERNIGVDVFGRRPLYDTGADSIVRTCAIEIRKRLAQYYLESGRDSEVRIELPHGSYVPQFRFPDRPSAPSTSRAAPGAGFLRRHWILAAAAPVVAAGAILVATRNRDPVDMFWSPFLDSAGTVTLAIGDQLEGLPSDGTVVENARTALVRFPDAWSAAQITGILRVRGKMSDIRCASLVTLPDLRRGPSVMIGAFNNTWTLRLQDQLRFTVRITDTGQQILDQLKPDAVLVTAPAYASQTVDYSVTPTDYAVISRFTEQRSQQPVLIFAGLGGGGTRAAAEFVTQPKYLEMLRTRMPRNWERKNLQVVIAVDLVKGDIGAPRIVATHTW